MAVIKLILLAIILMAFVVAGLAIKILLKKDGKFPNTHIGGNKHMKERGVTCAQTYDKIEQAKVRRELQFKNLLVEDSDANSFC
jgi:hypothetical protein